MLMEKEMAESDKRICKSAIDMVTTVCDSVINGTVNLQMLDKIKHHQVQMHRLSEAITYKPSAGSDAKPTETHGNWINFMSTEMKIAIQKRRREHDAFQRFYRHLCHLFTHLRDLEIQGLEH